ncbi:MAG: YigZ family protein [Treponema sp.]|uniref:YigZ family protein n=1 Tax=Treponema sp. TaxID=166 RepID=UPI001B48440E|nr:YigZ family protein [Treponema sp.]MBP5403315.1 YigZ family protein [Treponema sp.]MBR5932641.1 YigZ family protein [Treponema sp.]
MNVLTKQIVTELTVKNSRFINELFICDSQGSARSILKQQKDKYQDASHVCHAFVIGKAGEVLGMSDDGEPGGTAGRPMLDVLKGSGITNVLLTVTRYFGGTLLGTGGLVKAYGDCAKSAVEKAVQENAVEELLEKKDFTFSASYQLYEIIKRQIKDYKLYDLEENFSDTVTLKGKILAEQYEDFSARIKNLSSGQIVL